MKEGKDGFRTEIVCIVIFSIGFIFCAFMMGTILKSAKTKDYEKEKPDEVYISELILCGQYFTSENFAEKNITSENFIGPDPMIEDTYLRDDIALDYETQMFLYGAAQEFEVPYEMALAVVEQETNYKNIMGDNGRAYGYMQIWPKWHSGLMDEIGAKDLMEPKDNFRTGCAILGSLLRTNSLEDTLTLYNSGKPGESEYSRSVIKRMQRLENKNDW